MSEDIQIRTVAVEFLRAGPPHNQLLSPLTQYLAVCGDAGAGVVTVPYEHAAFERRLKELRYETGDTADRLQMLNDIGVEMGKLLGAVPGLPGALTIDPSKAATLIQLRLTLSANELAHLPFELAKVPVGAGATSETWLAIQTRPPVCVTRNIRTVSSEGVAWPHKPRILFISGDPDVVPFVEHRDALLDAIKPFRYPGLAADSSGNREEIGDLLTILTNASLAEVQQECLENTYSHVHILTHGDQDEASRDSYGLVLRGEDDSPDVVSGERFANALTSVGRDCVHRPAVVTVASCDSGNIGTVTIPGASFAHALHQAGIPLVVASQFPLSMVGSVPLARTLYPGLLWGDHPLLVMQRLRAELHARYTSTWHDWASLVVYEALPYDLAQQLDRLRYSQSRRAMDSALEAIDRAVQSNAAESLPELDAAIERAVQRLPMTGQYSVECLGLRASARKRLAQAAFTLSGRGAEVRKWRDPFDLLEQSWVDYRDAVRRLLVNDGTTVQRVATLHWVLVQAVCLAAVLGKDKDLEQWETAKLCADLYCDHADQEERAWAYASLAELYLLRLGERGLSHELQRDMHKAALEQADRLVGAYPFRTEFPVTSTLRQFRRYVDWWGQKRFQDVLTERASARPSWDALLGTANELIRKLDRGSTHAAPGGGAPPSSTPPSSALTGSSPPGSPPPGSPPPGSPPPGSPPPGSPPPGSPPPGSPPPGSPPPGAAPAVAGARTNADGARLASESSSRGRSRRVPSATAASSSATVRREGPFFDVETLPAGHGDALWIEYGDASATHRLLVDCGTQQTVAHLMARVGQVPEGERRLELFVMSHIDSDHIGGALPFFRAVKDGLRFGDVWFNGWRHLSGQLGARQGEMFSTALQDFKLPWNQWRDRDAIVIDSDELPVCQLPGGMTLTLLSPQPAQLARLAPVWMREMKRYGLEPGSRVDYSRFLRGSPSSSTDIDALADTPFSGDGGVPNGTSIALLAEFGGAALLLGADAYAPVLVDTIKRLLKQRGVDKLKLAAFKVAHHGSQNNSSNELIELLDCPEYLLSSNGDHFCHPDREAVARIIRHGGPRASLRFNYRTRYNDVWAQPGLQERYGYAAHYPAADASGVVLSLLAPRS